MDGTQHDPAPRGCADCGLHAVCLPAGVDADELAALDRLTRIPRTLGRGEPLFRQGQAFEALYVVRSGAVRTSLTDADGGMQVIGFGLPGEVLGTDGLLDDSHCTDAVALERSSICVVPYHRMEEAMVRAPALQRQLMRVVGQGICAGQRHAVAMGRPQAAARVALFLRDMAERYGRLSRPTDCIRLAMSRPDIASYLGLAVETVSRALGRMEDAGLLAVSGRTVRILDRPGLERLGAGEAPASP